MAGLAREEVAGETAGEGTACPSMVTTHWAIFRSSVAAAWFSVFNKVKSSVNDFWLSLTSLLSSSRSSDCHMIENPEVSRRSVLFIGKV